MSTLFSNPYVLHRIYHTMSLVYAFDKLIVLSTLDFALQRLSPMKVSSELELQLTIDSFLHRSIEMTKLQVTHIAILHYKTMEIPFNAVVCF